MAELPTIKNRKAFYDYHILSSMECGISLLGSEVKSIRQGNMSIKEGWVDLTENLEALLKDTHIAPYVEAHQLNHEPRRERKLLIKKKDIIRLYNETRNKGISLIPLKVYFKGRRIKVQIALVKGKKSYDKRESLKTKEADRDIAAAMKRSQQDT